MKYTTLIPLALIILGLALWWHTLNFPFLFDDLHDIVQADHIKEKVWYEFFFVHGRWITCAIHSFLFRTVGYDVFWYRFIPLSMHIATSIILFFLMYLLGSNARNSLINKNFIYFSTITALLFLIHPVQTQTVLYVVQGQCEGLAALCITLTVLCMSAFFLAQKKWLKWLAFGFMMLSSFISFGSKEVAIMTPVLCLMIDWFFISQGSWQRLKKHMWLHLFLLIFYVTGYMIILKPQFFVRLFQFNHTINNNIGSVITHSLQEPIGIYQFFISQAKVLLHYLFIFIWPFSLSPDYGWKLDQSMFDISAFSAWALLIACIGYAGYRLYKNQTDFIAFGLLWFFLILAPRSSIIPGSELVSDYKTYSASIGIFMLMAYGLCRISTMLHDRLKKKKYAWLYKMQVPLAACVVALACIRTIDQGSIWASGESFWKYIIDVSDTPRAHNNYALEMLAQNNMQAAQQHLEMALKKDSQYTHAMSNLAFVYAKQKLWSQAIALSLSSVKLSPSVEAYNNLAYYLYKVKEYDAALMACTEALRIKPGYKPAIFITARNQCKKENFEAALALLDQCTGDFKHPKLHALHARTLKKLNNFDAALTEYKLAIKDLPQKVALYREMGDCFAHMHDHQKAGVLYAAATQLAAQSSSKHRA